MFCEAFFNHVIQVNMLPVCIPVGRNNIKLSLFHNSHVADTPQTTSVMIYIASVRRKRFVYIISLNQPNYTVDDQGSARP